MKFGEYCTEIKLAKNCKYVITECTQCSLGDIWKSFILDLRNHSAVRRMILCAI